MSSPALPPLHVIAGAGQIGPLVAERLVARGLRVRMIRRGATFDGVPPGVETVSTSVADGRTAAEAMRGASVVYNCANARYHRWAEELIPLTRGIAEGAARVGARLVVLDNLYMYGLDAEGRMAEDTAIAPVSKKGALRAEAAALLLEMHRRGDVAVSIARGADFIGPRGTRSIFGDRFWQRLLAGKPVELLGDPEQPHSYTYTLDTADALVTLGLAQADDVYGRVWHVPTLPAESTRTWVARLAATAGVKPRATVLQPLVLKMVGVVLREASGVPEMIYQWRQPFRLDDRAFRRQFGATPTAAGEIAAATVAWARATYAVRARAA